MLRECTTIAALVLALTAASNGNFCTQNFCCATESCNSCSSNCQEQCSTEACTNTCILNCIQDVPQNCQSGSCNACTSSQCCNTQTCNTCARSCCSQCSSVSCRNNCVNNCVNTGSSCNSGSQCCNTQGCNGCVNKCYGESTSPTECIKKCDKPAPEPTPEKNVIQPSKIIEILGHNSTYNTANKFNITTTINLHNIINNTNLIRVPIQTNYTNVNHIHVPNVGGGGKFTKEVFINTTHYQPYINKPGCCYVLHPKECFSIKANNTRRIKCIRRRHKECSTICTSSVVLLMPQPLPYPRPPLPKPNPPIVVPNPPILVQPPCLRLIPQNPVVLPQQPIVVPQKPIVIPQQPVVIPQQPVVVPQQPTVISQQQAQLPCAAVQYNQSQRCQYIQQYPWVYCGNYQKYDCGPCYYCGQGYQPQVCSIQQQCPSVCRNNLFM